MSKKFEVKEEEFLASKEAYERFIKNSPIWQDMKMIVEAWLADIKEALINSEQVSDEKALSDFQGRAKMCKLFLSLPEDTIYVLGLDELNEGENENG